MLHAADLVAFVGATDLDRARAFYAEKLGLTVSSEVVEGRGRVYRIDEFKGSSLPSDTVGTH